MPGLPGRVGLWPVLRQKGSPGPPGACGMAGGRFWMATERGPPAARRVPLPVLASVALLGLVLLRGAAAGAGSVGASAPPGRGATQEALERWPPRAASRVPLVPLHLRGGQGGPGEDPRPAEEGANGGGPTKSGAKALRKAAEKEARKRPDPEGTKRLGEGSAAFAEGRWDDAVRLFTEAAELCRASKAAAPPPPKDKARPAGAQPASAARQGGEAAPGPKLILAAPETNLQAKPMRGSAVHNYAANDEAVLKAYLDTFGDSYRTRFPPEPNGYLHIGHAKAIDFNFGQAQAARDLGRKGETILRMDDTNPEAEKQEYIDSILEDVAWLGQKPVKLTYTSDYFEHIYNDTLTLIEKGLAYVCFQTSAEMRASRSLLARARIERTEPPKEALSPRRDSEPTENLQLFERMRCGNFSDGEASLRMKGDLTSDNPAMWDPVFYRVKHSPPHPRSGSRWVIYPSYDLSHCIVDSIEGVSHSCCTLEFGSRQAPDGPYYWILNALGRYKPVTFEYSRCSVAGNVLSKRRLQQLVQGGYVEGWDDPRLLTLQGLRRRGYTASSIHRFTQVLGVTATVTTVAQPHLLESCIREELDAHAPRVFAVLRPLRVDIENAHELPELCGQEVAEGVRVWAAYHPKNASAGGREVPLRGELYIDRCDFRDGDAAAADPGFKGLSLAQPVGLLATELVLSCVSVRRGSDGAVESLVGRVAARAARKPKGNLQWVCDGVRATCRLYGPLLLEQGERGEAEQAEQVEGGELDLSEEDQAPQDEWLKAFNKDSVETFDGCLVEQSVADRAGQAGFSMQFMRVGYFCVDSTSAVGRPVLNRIVTLSAGAQARGQPAK